MGSYTYKEVAALIPERIAAKYDDFDDPGYDGGLHEAASDYICELLAALAARDAELAEARATIESLDALSKQLAAALGTAEGERDEARARLAAVLMARDPSLSAADAMARATVPKPPGSDHG